MTWWSKLPSLTPVKGLIRFFYVWAHWETISADIEGYRRQIKDREDWAKTALELKDKLHEMAKEQFQGEVDAWRTRAEGSKQLADDIGEACGDIVLLLARLLQREGPLTRVLLLNSLDQIPRVLVERMLAKLPPPFPPPPLNLKDLKPPPL